MVYSRICDSVCWWTPDQSQAKVDKTLQLCLLKRISNTEKALNEVDEILNKTDNCEKLFPSTSNLLSLNESWRNEEFQNRIKVKN